MFNSMQQTDGDHHADGHGHAQNHHGKDAVQLRNIVARLTQVANEATYHFPIPGHMRSSAVHYAVKKTLEAMNQDAQLAANPKTVREAIIRAISEGLVNEFLEYEVLCNELRQLHEFSVENVTDIQLVAAHSRIDIVKKIAYELQQNGLTKSVITALFESGRAVAAQTMIDESEEQGCSMTFDTAFRQIDSACRRVESTLQRHTTVALHAVCTSLGM